MQKSIIKFLSLTVFIALESCSATGTEKADTIKTVPDSATTNNQLSDAITVDSNQVDKAVLTNMYVKAIQDYIEAIHQKDKTAFDTLYFANRKMGGPDDFPDIELPKKISGVEIVLLSFGEAHTDKINQYKETSPVINLMGWVDKEKAEFIFVTFFPEFNHKYDCYINYKINSERKDYEMEKLTIRVLVKDKNGKADHFAIYQDAKHIGDRPIEENKK